MLFLLNILGRKFNKVFICNTHENSRIPYRNRYRQKFHIYLE